QAEDGIRYWSVTGVQTCALPISSDQSDAGAYFTNYGVGNVDIAAPGVSTLSTVPTGNCPLCDPSGYKSLSGTSMATPHVTGVIRSEERRVGQERGARELRDDVDV